MTLRRVVAAPARAIARRSVRIRTRSWPKRSRLFAVGERSGWSVDEDARHLEATALRLDYHVAPSSWARHADDQAVFLTSHFEALHPRWLESSHRLGTAYLHGRPGTPGYPEFDVAFETLRRNANRFARIQVTHDEMYELVVSAGVDPGRVFRIPIGIDLDHFAPVDAQLREAARETLDLPADAFVVGSFQKDGIGWGSGLEPKLIKGPDLLVAVLAQVRAAASELVALLTGPARGYVRHELDRLGIPYKHHLAHSRLELARAYHALDVCVVASRQEGGPKAVLEAMAAGVPLVTTRVGQAQELVDDGRNGVLVDVDDPAALAEAVLRMHADPGMTHPLVAAGRVTAEGFDCRSLDSAWNQLLSGFVEISSADP